MLGVIRRIFNLAAGSWHDENGLTWLGVVPKITMLHLCLARRASCGKMNNTGWKRA